MATNMARSFYTVRVFHKQIHIRGHVRSGDKLKTLNLHYNNVFGNLTFQSDDIELGGPTDKVK